MVYVAGDSNQFGTLDLQTRTYTQINANNGQRLGGLANYNGQLYATREINASSTLYTVATNGNLTSIGSTGFKISGIAFDSTGILYAHNPDIADRLGTLNLATGAYTNIGNIGTQSSNISGVLAFSNGTLYDSVWDGGGSRLLSLNTLTGVGTGIGSGNSHYTAMPLFDAQNVLYGIGIDMNLYSVNTATGGLTSLGAITGANLPARFLSATAVTTNNVPEPSSLGLFAIGSLLMGFARKRSHPAD